jgi:hypothetical protein
MVCGNLAVTFVGVATRIVGTKMKVLWAKAAIEKPNMIPADRIHRIIDGVVRLLVQYVPQGLHADVERELRLMEIGEGSGEPRRTAAAK